MRQENASEHSNRSKLTHKKETDTEQS